MTKANTGDYNTGYRNTGDRNTGNRNTGYHNTGNHNTGNYNTGWFNTGNYNTGDRNTGYRNTGYHNTGNRNTGYHNTGDHNTGNRNTGNHNTGNYNTGYHNTGNYNTGWFNTETPDGGYFFNKWLTFDRWKEVDKPSWIFNLSSTTWVVDSEMTPQEKTNNPTFHICGGYLRVNDMKKEWKKAYKSATPEDVQMVRDLPNFDYDVFEEITGLDLRLPTEPTCDNKIVEIDGKKYKLVSVE